MRRVCGVLAVCIASFGAVACGQKGPLYLPDKSGTVITRQGTTPTETPPAQDSTPKDEENEEGKTPR